MTAELEKFDKVPLLVGDTTFSPEWHINFHTPMMITEIQKGVRSAVARVAPGKVPPVDF